MPGISASRIAIPFRSMSSYWATQSEVLFFGEISKITDGKLYNQKAGAIDYLTVGGVAGSYTFQAPNTAPYIAADTDYIWFNTDASQRIVTTANLIGFDLQRTPVKYLDDSPNTLEAIMILSSAVTGDKRDRLFRDMHLSILWDNNLNGFGHIKSNRVGQNLWTGYETESSVLFARMVTAGDTLIDARKIIIDTCILGLKIAGLWTKFDALYLFAANAAASADLNWVSASYNLTPTGSPVFESDRGYTGASGKYLKTGLIPSAGGLKYVLNSASFGVYCRTSASAANTSFLGAQGASGAKASIITPRYTDNNTYIKINSASADQNSTPNTDTRGLFIGSRTSSTALTSYIRTTPDLESHNSSSVTDKEMYILCINANGTAALNFIGQLSFAFIGSGLTDADVVSINSIIVDGYLASIGAKL